MLSVRICLFLLLWLPSVGIAAPIMAIPTPDAPGLVYAHHYNDFNAAVNEGCGSSPRTLVIAKDMDVVSSITVLATCELQFVARGLLVCNSATVTIQSSTANWPNRQIFASDCLSTGSVILGKGGSPVIYVDWFEDDATVDRSAALQRALSAPPYSGNNIAALGATQIRLSNAVYLFSTEILVPASVDIWGSGRGSILRGTAAGAKLNYSGVGGGEPNAAGIHGVNGNFTIDGDNVANIGMRIGVTTLSMFDLHIVNTEQEGLRLEGTQNSVFLNLFINHVGNTSGVGTSVVIDGASAGNAFMKCEFNDAGRSHLLQTKTLDGNGPTIGSFNNMFRDVIFERYQSTANATAAIELYAGSISVDNSQILGPGASGKPAVLQRTVTYNSTVFEPSGSFYNDCDFGGLGSGVGQTVFDSDVPTFSSLVIQGKTRFSGNTTVFYLDDQTNVVISGAVTASSITNWFLNNGGGSSVATARITQSVDARLLYSFTIPSGYTSNIWQGFEGATNRFALTGNGRLNVTRYRATLGTALVAGDFTLSAGWGNTASIGSLTGTDQRMQFTVTSAGTGQSANPTITLTYKDGTWATAPFVQVVRNGGTGTGITGLTWSTTATILTITTVGTPVAGETYVITVSVMG